MHHVEEMIWRRHYAKSYDEAFNNLLNHMATLYPPPKDPELYEVTLMDSDADGEDGENVENGENGVEEEEDADDSDSDEGQKVEDKLALGEGTSRASPRKYSNLTTEEEEAVNALLEAEEIGQL